MKRGDCRWWWWWCQDSLSPLIWVFWSNGRTETGDGDLFDAVWVVCFNYITGTSLPGSSACMRECSRIWKWHIILCPISCPVGGATYLNIAFTHVSWMLNKLAIHFRAECVEHAYHYVCIWKTRPRKCVFWGIYLAYVWISLWWSWPFLYGAPQIPLLSRLSSIFSPEVAKARPPNKLHYALYV